MPEGGEGYFDASWFAGQIGSGDPSYWHINWWPGPSDELPSLQGKLLLLELSSNNETRYYSSVAVKHPTRWYDPRILSYGIGVRSIPNPPGMPIVGNVSIKLSNADGHFTTWKTTDTIRGGTGTLYIGPEGGSFSNDFSKIFEGTVYTGRIMEDQSFLITLRDYTYDLFNRDVSGIITEEQFPNLPEKREPWTFKPIIYGNLSATGGAVPCPYVDTVAHRHLVAQTAVHSVDDVYLYGQHVEDDLGMVLNTDYFIDTTTVDGVDHTFIRFDTDQVDPDRPGVLAVTANVRGATLSGGAGGALATSPIECLRDFLVNHVGITFSKFEKSSWNTANQFVLSRGWLCNGAILELTSIEDVIARFLSSFNMFMFVNIRGRLDIKIFDTAEAIAADPETYDETQLILMNTFSQAEQGNVKNKVSYQYDRDWLAKNWRGFGSVEDAQGLSVLGRVYEDSPFFWFVGDATTALDVAQKRLFLRRTVSDIVEFEVPAPETMSNLEIGEYINVTHYQRAGPTEEPIWISGLKFDFDKLKYSVTGIRTNLVECHVLADRDNPPSDYPSATDAEKETWWYLADEITGKFGDGSDPHTFCS